MAAAGSVMLALSLAGCPTVERESDSPSAERKTASNDHQQVAKTPGSVEAAPRSTESRTTVQEEAFKEGLSEEIADLTQKPRDYGPPLVDNADVLQRLHPTDPVWIDPKNKQVVLQGEVCKAGYPLEFFATYSNRDYESVVSVNVKPSIVHAGLLAVGAKPGRPAQFDPKFSPPTGTEIAIEVRWKDADGKTQSSPAQQWIRNIKTGKPLDSNWVFAGSKFLVDETTGQQYYQADSGELICVLSLPNAMLDLPMLNYKAIEARSYEAFEEHLPPPKTPVTILLKPIFPDQ